MLRMLRRLLEILSANIPSAHCKYSIGALLKRDGTLTLPDVEHFKALVRDCDGIEIVAVDAEKKEWTRNIPYCSLLIFGQKKNIEKKQT